MRLWSLHPRHLDVKGLVACWREGLLARKVLMGGTKGYKNHPQLNRFKAYAEPVVMLDGFLLQIWKEAERRGYSFNREKIGGRFSRTKIKVTTGQIQFEWKHLKSKLKKRDPSKYKELEKTAPSANLIFRVVEGDVADWEKTG